MMVSPLRMGAVCLVDDDDDGDVDVDDDANEDFEDKDGEDDDIGFTFLENRSGMIWRRWRLLKKKHKTQGGSGGSARIRQQVV